LFVFYKTQVLFNRIPFLFFNEFLFFRQIVRLNTSGQKKTTAEAVVWLEWKMD